MEIRVRDIYSFIFIIGLILTFTVSNVKIVGCTLLALFGLVGFFTESILDRIENKENTNDEE
jgi:hypothetical protein